jgi:hypothetical protein
VAASLAAQEVPTFESEARSAIVWGANRNAVLMDIIPEHTCQFTHPQAGADRDENH